MCCSYFFPGRIHEKTMGKSWKINIFRWRCASLSSCNSSASKPTMSTASNRSATGTPPRYQGHGDPQQSIEKLYKIVISCFLGWLLVDLPLWKIWKPVGMMTFPTEWKNKSNVPNHQPVGDDCFFPTCQVRVVRFYVSCLVLLLLVLLLLSLSSSSSCSTATRDPQCSLSDLNREYPRPVFPAGPQPRPSPPSVPCRTSTTTIHAQCSLPDLNREYPRQVFPAGPHVGR